MQRRVILSSVAATALLCVLCAGEAHADDDGAHAAYSRKKLRDHAGKATSLKAAAGGQRLVVAVLKGTWCQVCVDQLKRLSGMADSFSRLGTRVVGLTHEGHVQAAGRAKEAALSFPILSDPNHDVLGSLGLWSDKWGHPLPALMVFDSCGRLRGMLRGRRPGQRPEASLIDLLRKVAKDDSCDVPRA